MRLAIVAMDTRGGVQPYVALGAGFRDAGHEVRIVSQAEFAPMFESHALPFTTVSGSAQDSMAGAAGATTAPGMAAMRRMKSQLNAQIPIWTREILAGCEGADVVTGGIGGSIVGVPVAERLGVPFIATHLQPINAPTGTYPGVLMPGTPAWLGPAGRFASHYVSDLAATIPFASATRIARSTLGLTGRGSAASGKPVLYGFSRRVVPLVDRRNRHVTGYWSLPAAGWTPPPGLQPFLDADGPVVSIGFGSMMGDDRAVTTRLVAGAAHDAGVRAVLLSGWGGLGKDLTSEEVFSVDEAPHDWLFPRVTASVHHGGAGTTGAALIAGTPAVVVPVAVDQPFWGSRVHSLGVGPRPIPRRRLTRENLAAAIRQVVGDTTMAERARDLGVELRAETGVSNAVQMIERATDQE